MSGVKYSRIFGQFVTRAVDEPKEFATPDSYNAHCRAQIGDFLGSLPEAVRGPDTDIGTFGPEKLHDKNLAVLLIKCYC